MQSTARDQQTDQKKSERPLRRMNPIFSRRVHRVPPVMTGLSWSGRRRKVQKGGMILPSRIKRLDNGWVKNALQTQHKKRRR